MYNKPTGTSNKISIGPGRVFLGPVGATPSIDVGYVKDDFTISLMRTGVDVRQGSPQILIDKLASQEDVSIEFKGIEWNFENLARVCGDGATSVSGADLIYKLGGAPGFQKYALMYQHKMADGGTMSVDIWKVMGEGQVVISAKAADIHDIAYKFNAMDAGSTDWAGASLTDGQALIRIRHTRV